ncbi:MAG: non-canonical purine NTP pyrophosphatase [Streptosporangiaceae bacterium]
MTGPDPAASVPRLVLATANQHKLIELTRILAAGQVAVEPCGLADFPGAPDVRETGATFAENALLKARAIAAFTGLPAVADDSGLCVDALNGMPGVFSARWSGRHGDDDGNLRLVLSQLADVPEGRRGAQFACSAALVLPAGRAHVCEEAMHGWIIREPRGANGFGYDPIFVPDRAELAQAGLTAAGLTVAGLTAAGLTTAELDPEAKDRISHRGKALRALAPVIGAWCL